MVNSKYSYFNEFLFLIYQQTDLQAAAKLAPSDKSKA